MQQMPTYSPSLPTRGHEEGIPWGRYLSALWRQKWILGGFLLLGSVAGLAVSRSVKPLYQAEATVWVTTPRDGQDMSGPIRAGNLLQSRAWTELFRSFAIADSVVNTLRLYVAPQEPRDSALFADFHHADRFRTGLFTLRIDSGGAKYVLLDAAGNERDHGLTTDSIGRPLGFLWSPPRALLTHGRTVAFRVVTPRDASIGLLNQLTAILPEDGNFLRLQLAGTDPQLTARTLNAWVTRFVAQAEALKKRNLIEFEKILESQLIVAETEMRNAEIALETFRVNTITLPSEGGPVAAGVEMSRDPVMQSYFRQKTEYDDLRHDREALEQVVTGLRNNQVTPDRLMAVPGVLAGSPALQSALNELTAKQAQLRAVRTTLTDAHPTVRSLSEGVRVMEKETIPQLASSLLDQLRQRESDLKVRIDDASGELKRVPPRTIEEMRLRRQVTVSENLYNTLKSRYEEARLAEAGATPDVSVLDYAVAPIRPSSNGAPRVLGLAILVSLALSVFIVLFWDRVDRTFRYPEQATRELGLAIAGAVPRLRRQRDGEIDIDLMTRTVEAFRTLRLSLRYRFAAHEPVVVTVTSPGTSDGKSVVSSNLALSFANAGYRTLLIDGDVRRGRLHATFGVHRSPGLVDVLRAGSEQVEPVMQSVPATENLWLLSSGTQSEFAPELLGSATAGRLVADARSRFEVVIIDSPPLSAGVDAYALGVAAGALLLVLRAGTTDRKLAEAKLQVLDRLPVRLVGAVLNDIGNNGEYRYYTYKYDVKSKKNPRTQVRIPSAAAARAGTRA